jgi:hypothetical protein
VFPAFQFQSSILARFCSVVTYDTLEAIHLKGPVIKNR